MTAAPLAAAPAMPRIGERVEAGGVTGEIVAWRGQPEGAGLAADAAVDVTAAKGLARLILAGKAPPMPINLQLNALAAALLAASTEEHPR